MKLKIGFFSFTCCEGCMVVFLETLNKKYDEYLEKIEIENFRMIKPDKEIKKLDIAFVEGAISTKEEIKILKEIRKKSKKVIALGSGAINGSPSNQRNRFNIEIKKEISKSLKNLNQLKEISPLSKFVKVDDNIPGCPVSEDLLIKKIDEYLK